MQSDIWWEHRREGEPTNEYLARVLEELGASDIAEKARLCHFDDFQCPAEVADGLEKIRLVDEVRTWCIRHKAARRGRRFLQAIVRGEFDNTAEEAYAWSRSKEGQETFKELQRDMLIPKERQN